MKVGKPKFWIDSDALMQFAQDNLTDDVHDAAEDVADRIRAKVPDDVPVTVRDEVNDSGRPVSIVTIEHASGLARQAKDGVITMSVAEAGHDVHHYEGVGE